jgi:alkylhydroperoxidase family enzyme
MARMPYLTKDDLDEADKPLLDRDINLVKALAHNPAAARAFSHLGGYIRYKASLDPRLRELAILQVGYLAKAPYEYSHHVKIGFDFGVTETDIHGLEAESAGEPSELEPLAKTVLRAAREMTDDGAMAEATFRELEEALGRPALVDLIVTVAFYNGVVRLLGSLEIDVEDSYQQYLEQFPLPE